MSNDVWSLGIILLNLATGRNPWKTATLDDSTFQAYLRSPMDFFPSVLPVSRELNEVLVRMLHIDWRERLTILELREMMETVDNFYSDDAVIEGSMARCPWEAGLEIEGEPHHDSADIADEGLKSYWSNDSMLNPPSTDSAGLATAIGLSNNPSWSASPVVKIHSSDSMVAENDSADITGYKSSLHSSPITVTPATSHDFIRTLRPVKNRFVNTIPDESSKQSSDENSALSSASSMQLTAEDGFCSPADFEESLPTSLEDSSSTSFSSSGMPADWVKNASTSWACSSSQKSSTPSDHSSISGDTSFVKPAMRHTDRSHSPTPPPGSGISVYTSRASREGKSALFNSFNFFSRGTHCSTTSTKFSEEHCTQSALPRPARARIRDTQAPTPARIDAEQDKPPGRHRSSRFASPRHWFFPGKLFASPIVS